MTKFGPSVRDAAEVTYRDATARLFDFPRTRFPRNRYEAALRILRPGRRVLDIGCADGLMLYNVRDRFEELAGIDFLPARVAIAQSSLRARGVEASLHVTDVNAGIPWPDGYFDAVMWTDVIQFVPDLFGAMREIARVTAPGGQLVTTAPNIGYLRRIADLLRGRFPGTSAGDQGFAVATGGWYDEDTIHYFTFKSLAKLYDRAGFDVRRAIGHGKAGFIHALYPPLLSGGICMYGVKRA
jgi:SAM-dependent methyltransferase